MNVWSLPKVAQGLHGGLRQGGGGGSMSTAWQGRKARNDALPPHAHRPLFSRKPRDYNCFSTTLRHSTQWCKFMGQEVRESSTKYCIIKATPVSRKFGASGCDVLHAHPASQLYTTEYSGEAFIFEMKEIPDIPKPLLPGWKTRDASKNC